MGAPESCDVLGNAPTAAAAIHLVLAGSKPSRLSKLGGGYPHSAGFTARTAQKRGNRAGSSHHRDDPGSSEKPMTPTQPRFLAAVSVFAGGLIIGLTLVSFPASSAFLKQTHGFSDAQYGAIYLPQLVAAVIGAVGGGFATRRLGMRMLFLVSLACFGLAQFLLWLSGAANPVTALTLVMCATASFGFGFGFGGGPLNAYAALLFPERSTTAVTALHMSAGAGLTIGPALFAGLAAKGLWFWGPGALGVVTAAILVSALLARYPEVAAEPDAPDAGSAAGSGFFWLCAAVAMIYSVAEGTFSNWAILYLSDERAISPATAALALTAFWGSLTVGRLLASILVIKVSGTLFLLSLPLLMALAFWALPGIATPTGAIAGFAFAGFACSAFFPILVAFAAERFPREISWIASMLTAAMMVGVGVGSYAVGALRGSSTIASLYRFSALYPALVVVLLFLAMRAKRTPRAR